MTENETDIETVLTTWTANFADHVLPLEQVTEKRKKSAIAFLKFLRAN